MTGIFSIFTRLRRRFDPAPPAKASPAQTAYRNEPADPAPVALATAEAHSTIELHSTELSWPAAIATTLEAPAIEPVHPVIVPADAAVAEVEPMMPLQPQIEPASPAAAATDPATGDVEHANPGDPAPALTDVANVAQAELPPKTAAEPAAERLAAEVTAEAYVEAAQAALEGGDPAAALALLHDAAPRFPDVPAVHRALAQTAAMVANWPLAEHAWRACRALIPGDGDAHAGLAAALRAEGRTREAEAVLADGIAAAPAHAGLAIEYARMADERGDWPVAADRWHAVAEVAPHLPDGPVGQAVALQRLGRVGEAEAVLAELVQHFPEQPNALHDLARLSERRADWASAESWWRAYVALDSRHWWSYAALASAVCRQGRDAEAEAILHEGLARFPDQADLLAEYARFAETRNDWAEAIRRWDDVITRYPAAWAGYGGKVAALARMGHDAEADAALLAYGALLPEDPGALHDLGRRAERVQDWQAAEAAWRGFLRHEQRMDWGYIGLAQALARQDRLAAAARVLDDAMQRLPGSAELAIQAARVSEARGRFAEAAAHWRNVARLSPTTPDGAIGEASALARLGDSAAADAVIEAAIARLPDAPALYEAHAQNALTGGDRQAALARLRAGQQRFPDVPVFATRIADIQAQPEEPADDRIDPPPDPQADRVRALLLAFQSLGGAGGHGGEFATFQRDQGADPLGLLQWADALPDELAQALEAEFAGMGEPDQSDIFIPTDTVPAEYWITDRRYGMTMPCFIRADEVPPDQARHEIEKRLRFLRGKLIDDLRSGSRIFVYLHSKRTVTAPELDRLHAAMQRYGETTLLYIRPEDPRHPSGTVVWDRPGLLLGSIDHFTHAADTDRYLGVSSDSLLSLCGQAHTLWLERQAGQQVVPPGLPKAAVGQGGPGKTDGLPSIRLTDAEIALRFESLGGGGLNQNGWAFGCEFGFFQRHYGVEPMGLLRWASIAPDDLLHGLQTGFYEIEDPDAIEIRGRTDEAWLVTQKTYKIYIDHVPISREDASPRNLALRISRHLGFLRDKLISDLSLGTKLFIYHTYDHILLPSKVNAIAEAVGSYGPATLCYVDAGGGVPFTASRISDTLIWAHIDRFAPQGNQIVYNHEGWKTVCASILSITN